MPTDSAERPARTKKFQQINDAYYTLSEPSRRREYDAACAFGSSGPSAAPNSESGVPPTGAGSSGGGGFPWSAFGFGSRTESKEDFSREQFGDVFEEMLREEGMAEGGQARPTGKLWSVVGGLSGGAMGFILANFAGAVAGAVAGNRLGSVRDARGKSVYEVFNQLDQNSKMQLLSQLAAKVFAHAVGS